MLTRVQLDQRRADMMNALYQQSGRTNGLLTGLWAEFAHDIASNFRDADFADVHAACVTAIGKSESHLGEKHAQQAIMVCRQVILGEKWS